MVDHGVMPKQQPARTPWIEIELPPVLSNRIGDLATSAGWQVSQRAGRWHACTRESYLKQRPALLTIRPVDTPGLRPGTGYEVLGSLMDQEQLVSPRVRLLVASELARLEELGEADNSALLARFQLLFTNTPTSELPIVMTRFFGDIAQKRLVGSTLFLTSPLS